MSHLVWKSCFLVDKHPRPCPCGAWKADPTTFPHSTCPQQSQHSPPYLVFLVRAVWGSGAAICCRNAECAWVWREWDAGIRCPCSCHPFCMPRAALQCEDDRRLFLSLVQVILDATEVRLSSQGRSPPGWFLSSIRVQSRIAHV